MTYPHHASRGHDDEGARPEAQRPGTEESFLVRAARKHGWRAYAIPVLAAVTLLILVDIARPSPEQVASDDASAKTVETQTEDGDRGPGPDPAEAPANGVGAWGLPPGGEITQQGEGTYRAVGVPGASAGEGTELTTTYVVEVENGLDTAAYGGDDAFASLVDATLTDPRGWTDDPRYRFEHVAEEDGPDMRIQLTSPVTAKQICGGNLEIPVSCRTTLGGGNTVVINEGRWVRGAAAFEGDLGLYRQYLINHEVGHGIGYASHVPCGEDGALAPIMMQQTISVDNNELSELLPGEIYVADGKTCQPNPWPYPNPSVS